MNNCHKLEVSHHNFESSKTSFNFFIFYFLFQIKHSINCSTIYRECCELATFLLRKVNFSIKLFIFWISKTENALIGTK